MTHGNGKPLARGTGQVYFSGFQVQALTVLCLGHRLKGMCVLRKQSPAEQGQHTSGPKDPISFQEHVPSLCSSAQQRQTFRARSAQTTKTSLANGQIGYLLEVFFFKPMNLFGGREGQGTQNQNMGHPRCPEPVAGTVLSLLLPRSECGQFKSTQHRL